MGQLVTTCPHCNAVDIALELFGAKPIGQDQKTGEWRAAGGAVCRRCRNAIGVSIVAPPAAFGTLSDFDSALAELYDDPVVTLTDINCNGFVVRTPEQTTETPTSLPDATLRSFSAAEKNFHLEGCEDASAIMYRRAIETAIHTKHPDVTGNLLQRIDKLAAKNLIPEAMKDWAHEIRLIGNDGAHGIDGVTREELTASRGFTDAFLRYLISLPEEVRLRREARNAPTIGNV
ncbi:DUF4145 domain-containing protein [Brucella sp.]|uniref:DUF4145 domain-containing protein n=1 Tax=Brucella sp. TaxID=52132 RepID=UPI0028A861B3|nr:DUF4145 domain-containing protein [Brucella sp.]